MGKRTQIPRSPDPSLALPEQPRTPEHDASAFPAIVLDRFGIVDQCNAAAGELFGGALTLLGRPITGAIPGIPIRHGTPGYNLAYAAYWASHARYRRFTGIDCRGDAFDIDVRLECLPLNGVPRIALALRPAVAERNAAEYCAPAASAATERPACC